MLTFTILCFLLSFVHAIPLVSRDVVDPPITSPNASTVWTVGQTVTVTWDTSNVPPDSQQTNPDGQVVLGFMANETDTEHLMLDSPLAQNFKLSAGQVSFRVPAVVTRDDYIVVLFGDSGNRSPMFTIQGSASSLSTDSVASPTSSMSIVPLPVSGTTSVTSDRSATASPPIATTSTSITSTFTDVVTTTAISPVSSASSFSGSSSAPSSLGTSSIPSASAVSASSAADSSSNGVWKAHNGHAYAAVVAGFLVFFQL